MLKISEIQEQIQNGKLDDAIILSIGHNNESAILEKRQRLMQALNGFAKLYGTDRKVILISSPGRTELGGNHTDHQGGRVLAASVELDTIAVVALRDDYVIHLQSEGHNADIVSLQDLKPRDIDNPHADELIRGVVAKMMELGVQIPVGFDAYTMTNVKKGSGLSSSAAFEILVGSIVNVLYAGNRFTPVELAQIGQYAENVYYHKPCGLMDQMASAVGGVVTIDFADNKNPIVEQVEFDFSKNDYQLVIIDTGGNHADLTAEYAAVPAEMFQAAKFFGKEKLSQVEPEEAFAQLGALRTACGDRSMLRCLNFMRENARVSQEVEALRNGNMEDYLKLVNASGLDSFRYLQNVYASSAPLEQPASVALAAAEQWLQGKGAVRIHGGGFGGTIQAFVPKTEVNAFCQYMETIIKKDCCMALHVRPVGTVTFVD